MTPRLDAFGGLQRHEREVHGAEGFICPIISCKWNKKGLARKYNLLDHQKRCHGLGTPNHFEKVHRGGSGRSSGGGSLQGAILMEVVVKKLEEKVMRRMS